MSGRAKLGVTIGFVVLACAAGAAEAHAASLPCAQRDDMAAHLARVYGERLAAAGLSGAGQAIEIFAAPDGVTFTILRSWPNGVSCVVDHGENWRPVKSNPEDQPGEQGT